MKKLNIRKHTIVFTKMTLKRKFMVILSGLFLLTCVVFLRSNFIDKSNNYYDNINAISNSEVSSLQRRQISSNALNPDSSLYTQGRHWKHAGDLLEDQNKNRYSSGKFTNVIIFDYNSNASIDYNTIINKLNGAINKISRNWFILLTNFDEATISTIKTTTETKWRIFKRSLLPETVKSFINDNISPLPLNVANKMAAVIYVTNTLKSPWIFMTDGSNPVDLEILDRQLLREGDKLRGMTYRGHLDVFQPCKHYMDPFVWAGKVDAIKQCYYELTTTPQIKIYQIVNGCLKPGMDDNWTEHFDFQVPVPYIPAGKYSPIDFNNIVVPYEASWTLFASMTSSLNQDKSVSRDYSLLSIFVQRMMWESPTQIQVGYLPGSQDISVQGCTTCSMVENIQFHIQNSFQSSLATWSCGNGNNKKSNTRPGISECFQNLLEIGANKDDLKKISKEIEPVIVVWEKIIKEFGMSYKHPKLPDTTETKSEYPSYAADTFLFYTPGKSLKNLPVANPFEHACSKNRSHIPEKKPSHVVPDSFPEHFQNVVLVMSFNTNTFLHNINYLDFMFARYFKHIVYCAKGMKEFEQNYKNKYLSNPVTFIDVETDKGYHGHKCQMSVMQLGYDVEGYLYISDDVILNVWNLHNAPLDVPWFQADMRVANYNNEFTHGHRLLANWYPWRVNTGRVAIRETMKKLKGLRNHPQIGKRVTWFLNNLEIAASCDQCVFYFDSDLYYIPAYMADELSFFSPFFEKVFQELSMPTMLAGITPRADQNIYRLRGFYLIDEPERSNFDLFYSYETVFIHPVKISQITTVEKVRRLFCGLLDQTNKDLKRFKGTI